MFTNQQAWTAAWTANRHAEQFGVEGRLTAADVFVVYAEESCAYCGALTDLGLDHVVPMRLGGVNALSNIVLACMPCNRRKAMTWERDIDPVKRRPRRL